MESNTRDYDYAGYESSESRFADVRAARQQRKAQRRPALPEKHDPYSHIPPCADYVMDDTAPPKKGSMVRVAVTQAVVCALLLGGLFGVRAAMPNTYKQLRGAYTQIMQTDLSVKEVWAVAKEVFAALREDVYVLAPYNENTTALAEENEPAAALLEDETEEQDVSEEEDEEEPNEDESQTEAKEETSAQEASSREDTADMGGLDVTLEYANRHCTFVPLHTTVRPLRPVAEGELTSLFGFRVHPITKEEGVHTGLDIAAPEGTAISAAFFGTVHAVGENDGYGKYIIMNHAGGLQTMYAHCSEIAALEGMTLRAGDTIAYVGSTGNSTGNHLHFEVRLNGLRCDPAPLFGKNLYETRQ